MDSNGYGNKNRPSINSMLFTTNSEREDVYSSPVVEWPKQNTHKMHTGAWEHPQKDVPGRVMHAAWIRSHIARTFDLGKILGRRDGGRDGNQKTCETTPG